jgi:hypothetical protein
LAAECDELRPDRVRLASAASTRPDMESNGELRKADENPTGEQSVQASRLPLEAHDVAFQRPIQRRT